MTPTAVALVSGGLDSMLALAAMARQGIRSVAYHGTNVFSPRTDTPEGRENLRARCLALGAQKVVFRDCSQAIIAFTKAPRFGYGKHWNACLDCRLMAIRASREVMQIEGADFLVTGEVVGQRPMSQRRDAIQRLDRIMREEMGLDGVLLRPLCAQLLPPTVPETRGWVDREALFAFHGRNRKPQMALAEAWGLTEYETPAGGCLLTDPGYASRLADLMRHQPDWGVADARLLRAGRHFRIDPRTKVVASRREEENRLLQEWAVPGDRMYITRDRPGGIILLRGEATAEAERIARGLAVHCSKFRAAGHGPVWRWRAEAGRDAGEDCGECERIDPETLTRAAE